MPFTDNKAHIETITKGPSQRVRRTIGYKVVANRVEIARFDIDPSDGSGNDALTAARAAMEDHNRRNV